MPTVSLVMVVRDEAQTLAAAIESALPVVDEVVIGVDRASRDDTAAIARHYASPGKLFFFDFHETDGGFAEARNNALRRAEGDYVLVLDGHERLPDDDDPVLQQLARMRGQNIEEERVPTTRAVLSTLQHDGMGDGYDVVCLTLAMNLDPVGIPQLFFLQPRLCRRVVPEGPVPMEVDGVPEIHYTNAVHNALTGFNNERTLGVPEGILVHNMPEKREAQRKKQRARMNFAGLRADVRRERRKPLAEQDARPFFYLGNSHADRNEHTQAIYWYEQYLRRSHFAEERMQALQQLSILYHRHKGNVEKARRYALDAVALQWRRAEPCVLLAEIAAAEKQWEEAIHWLTLAQQYRAPHTVMFLQGPVYSYLPDLQMARCYAELGRWPEACQHIDAALTWHPGDGSLMDLRRAYMSRFKRQPQDVNLLIVDRLGSFTNDLGQHFAEKGWQVSRRRQVDGRWRAWPDLAWFEWCDENLLQECHEQWGCPVVCRLHSYEAFGDLPGHIRWDRVQHLIFVAEHIRALAFSKWPEMPKQVATSVIPNGVDVSHLTYRERQHGRRIAFLGYLNHKKGVETLVQAIRVLPDYEFHIAGRFQDAHLAYFWEETTRDLHNVWLHGWIEPGQKDDWLEGMDYLISPSIVESFGYGIAEAMAKGIFPILQARPGALYPAHTFRSVTEIRGLLERTPYDSAAYRRHITENYSLEKQMAATDALVGGLLAARVEAPTNPVFLGVPLVDRLILE